MGIKIVVLGKNFSTPLGIVRSLGQVGYPIDVVYISEQGDSNIISSCKYVNRMFEVVGRHDKDILDLLLTEFRDNDSKYILFPTDDYTSSLIDRNRGILQERFLMPYVEGAEAGQITKYMDKAFQTELAKKHGLNAAQSFIAELSDNTINIPDDLVYPCLCKPLLSTLGFKSEIKKCRNKKELYNWLTILQKRKKNKSKLILIQEFLDIKEEYSIPAVCNNQEIIMPFLLKKICVAQAKRGVTLCGVTESTQNIKCVDKLMELLKSLQYVGLIDIEIFKTNDGIYFNELNFRSSGIIYAVTEAGANLPSLLVDALIKGTSVDMSSKEYGRVFLNDRVAWDDYLRGYISKRKFNKLEEMSHFSLILSEDDPEPGKVFLEAMKNKEKNSNRKIRFFKQTIKKFLGKV